MTAAAGAIRERKINRDFDTLDVNGDGFIIWENLKEAFEEGGVEFGHEPNSEESMRYLQACRRWWDKIAEKLGKDGNGRITREEFVAFHFNASPKEIRELVGSYVDALCGLFGTGEDRKISQQNFVSYLTTSTSDTSESEAREVFTLLDSDGDGYLSVDEFKKMAEEFFLSDDPASPSKHLLGKL
jgi:Ca2+-binding EF-hand superfamily protein